MTARSVPQVVSSRIRERQTCASTASMPNARPWRRGQAPKPHGGAPKAQGLTVAIAVAAPSPVPSFVPPVNLNSTGADVPINAFATARIYTSLTDVTLGGEPLRPAHRDRCHHWCLERCVSTEGSCRRLAGPDGRNATATAHPLPRPFRDTSTMVRRSEIQNNITFTRSFVRAATPMLAIVISLLGASWRSAKGRCTHDVRRLQAAATRTESARKQNPRSACILRLSCGAELEQLRRMGTAEYARFNLSYMN
jgi:hypothetical protein